MDRLEKLQQMLQRDPADTFLLYGIAMEYRKINEPAKAIEHLDRVIRIDPLYAYAYYQKGQAYESIGELELAKQAYREGVDAAAKKGDEHARGELKTALEMID